MKVAPRHAQRGTTAASRKRLVAVDVAAKAIAYGLFLLVKDLVEKHL